jgi:hypothetical protein
MNKVHSKQTLEWNQLVRKLWQVEENVIHLLFPWQQPIMWDYDWQNLELWLVECHERHIQLRSKYTIELELQIVSEMLRANTGSSCVFHSHLLGSWAVFKIVMRVTNDGH